MAIISLLHFRQFLQALYIANSNRRSLNYIFHQILIGTSITCFSSIIVTFAPILQTFRQRQNGAERAAHCT
jgi:hypothetical protein